MRQHTNGSVPERYASSFDDAWMCMIAFIAVGLITSCFIKSEVPKRAPTQVAAE
jgi:hypothetical protein